MQSSTLDIESICRRGEFRRRAPLSRGLGLLVREDLIMQVARSSIAFDKDFNRSHLENVKSEPFHQLHMAFLQVNSTVPCTDDGVDMMGMPSF